MAPQGSAKHRPFYPADGKMRCLITGRLLAYGPAGSCLRNAPWRLGFLTYAWVMVMLNGVGVVPAVTWTWPENGTNPVAVAVIGSIAPAGSAGTFEILYVPSAPDVAHTDTSMQTCAPAIGPAFDETTPCTVP
jgi:hypothetical protein